VTVQNLIAVNTDALKAKKNVEQWAREQSLTLPILHGSDDAIALYNIVYRYIFDRHRDIGLPTSFLIDEGGEIVKIYQGKLDTNSVPVDFRVF